MGAMSIWHWLIVLVIVLLVFGTKRLTGLGSDLGNAIKGFRSAMKEGEAEGTAAEAHKLEQADAQGANPRAGQAAPAAGAQPTPGEDKDAPKV